MMKQQGRPILSFDLDGTLMKPGYGDKVWLEGLPNIYAKTHDINPEKAKDQLLSAYDTLGKNRREWYDLSYWITKLKLSITPEELLKEFSCYIRPYPETPALIHRLSKKYRLIIASAAMKPFISIELQTVKLTKYFTGFFSATSDTQTTKKDLYFYTMITEELKCDPKEIIHVGDNYQFDFISPIQAGLYAFYLNRSKNSNDYFIVKDLKEFEERIKDYPFNKKKSYLK